ncbi:MAG: 4-alpha-glucanotransferase [Lachnospiraceae bacterium]|nr:4-alpha-glucanotransferase [Lachnospiraceae bacterium]
MDRACGILLPVFSLPSPYGIGCFSKEAYAFVDFLAAAGASYWQVLPMGPTGYGDSPYQSFSTFAGIPYFIDPETLAKDGWISKTSLRRYDFGKDAARIDYGKLFEHRIAMLREAYQGSPFGKGGIGREVREFHAFVRKNKHWLPDYALFMALKAAHGGASWETWEEDLRLRRIRAINLARREYADEIGFQYFLQFIFDKQWRALKAYAARKGIKIIGDLPIYVAYDSSDVWAQPELFYLDEHARMIEVAGCPPDDFTKLGQLWGNPLYRWDVHAKQHYAWWTERMRHAFTLYDVVRMDHFRGFEAYYCIKASRRDAVKGVWRKGPGAALFKAVEKAIGKQEIIAEDLGFLTPAVHKLKNGLGYPGMKVLQFAFYPDEKGNYTSDYLPYQYDKNCVVYTGTHDNHTTRGWWETMKKKDAAYAWKYLQPQLLKAEKKEAEGKAVTRAMVTAALASTADTAVLPMQDLLLLGAEARINTPSTIGENWVWRMEQGAASKALAKEFRAQAEVYGRL